MSRNVFLSAAALVSLAACATAPDTDAPARATATAADHHQIAVSEVGARLEVSFGGGGVDAGAHAAISEFSSAYLRGGHGPLVLSTPSAEGDAARAASEARLQLMQAGVPYDAITVARYEGAAADAPLVLSFTRYEATPPRCAPIWEQDLMRQYDNQPYESFGCANVANLAAMIEDPRDLVEPRGEAPRDATRRATVMENYRKGVPTGAARSGDETITISNAIH